jgi:hypothetical protein
LFALSLLVVPFMHVRSSAMGPGTEDETPA